MDDKRATLKNPSYSTPISAWRTFAPRLLFIATAFAFLTGCADVGDGVAPDSKRLVPVSMADINNSQTTKEELAAIGLDIPARKRLRRLHG